MLTRVPADATQGAFGDFLRKCLKVGRERVIPAVEIPEERSRRDDLDDLFLVFERSTWVVALVSLRKGGGRLYLL